MTESDVIEMFKDYLNREIVTHEQLFLESFVKDGYIKDINVFILDDKIWYIDTYQLGRIYTDE